MAKRESGPGRGRQGLCGRAAPGSITRRLVRLALLGALATGLVPAATAPAVPLPGHVGFAAKIKDIVTDYDVLGVFLLPGEPLDVEVTRPEETSGFRMLADGREIAPMAPGRWSWVAPAEKGLHSVSLVPPDGSEAMTLNVFVMVPFSSLRGGRINGYRIGSYPGRPKDNRAAYRLPRGFIEVTPDVEETRLSPSFRLKQFLCKQESGYPKYVILLERLVMKLELILAKANAEGLRAESFVVMSGYRTPYYNAAIGNVEFSMHQWGGAADIFIDESPRDGVMDDLNGDRAVDVKDAKVLQVLVERMETQELATPLTGGLGLYGTTSTHGPFIHVDVREFRARW
jgi:hypothetical protein